MQTLVIVSELDGWKRQKTKGSPSLNSAKNA